MLIVEYYESLRYRVFGYSIDWWPELIGPIGSRFQQKPLGVSRFICLGVWEQVIVRSVAEKLFIRSDGSGAVRRRGAGHFFIHN